jgi:hypothetical protein
MRNHKVTSRTGATNIGGRFDMDLGRDDIVYWQPECLVSVVNFLSLKCNFSP